MSPALQDAVAIAIACVCGIYLFRAAIRSLRRFLGRGTRGGTCGGGCGQGCSEDGAGQDARRRPVTLEKLPPH